MESQPQNPEFRNNSENFHPCIQGQYQNLKNDPYHTGIMIKSVKGMEYMFFY